MAADLKQKLIATRNTLIEQLEDTYNKRIASLLKQKKSISVKLLNSFDSIFI